MEIAPKQVRGRLRRERCQITSKPYDQIMVERFGGSTLWCSNLAATRDQSQRQRNKERNNLHFWLQLFGICSDHFILLTRSKATFPVARCCLLIVLRTRSAPAGGQPRPTHSNSTAPVESTPIRHRLLRNRRVRRHHGRHRADQHGDQDVPHQEDVPLHAERPRLPDRARGVESDTRRV